MNNWIYQGLKFNVNVTDIEGKQFRPTVRPNNTKEACKSGTLITRVPNRCYWELCISVNPNVFWPKNYCFKLESAVFENGDEIIYTNKDGVRNIYVNCIANNLNYILINSYNSGSKGKRFSFVAQSSMELDNGLAYKGHGKSNILNIKIGIYEEKKFNLEPKPQTRGGNTTQTRGGNTNQTRGGNTNQTRGGKDKVGSCIQAEGKSEFVKTVYTKSSFKKIYEFPVTIQLVNNEDDELKEEESIKIQQEIEEEKKNKILELQRQMDNLQMPNKLSEVLLKDKQKSYLIS